MTRPADRELDVRAVGRPRPRARARRRGARRSGTRRRASAARPRRIERRLRAPAGGRASAPHRRRQLPARAGARPRRSGCDAADARPPVGEVVRLGEEAPDVLERREQLRGAAYGRHGCPTLPEAEQVPDPLAEQARSSAAAPARRRPPTTIAPRPATREQRRAASSPTRRLTSRETPFASTRISPTFSRVTNVDDMPARFALEELDQVEVRADGDDQLGALLVREQQRDVLADPRRRHRRGTARRARRAAPRPARRRCRGRRGRPARRRSAARRRRPSPCRRRSRPACSPPRAARRRRRRRRSSTGLKSRMYGRTIAQVALVARPARDDERVPVAEARLERREVDALGEQAPSSRR